MRWSCIRCLLGCSLRRRLNTLKPADPSPRPMSVYCSLALALPERATKTAQVLDQCERADSQNWCGAQMRQMWQIFSFPDPFFSPPSFFLSLLILVSSGISSSNPSPSHFFLSFIPFPSISISLDLYAVIPETTRPFARSVSLCQAVTLPVQHQLPQSRFTFKHSSQGTDSLPLCYKLIVLLAMWFFLLLIRIFHIIPYQSVHLL